MSDDPIDQAADVVTTTTTAAAVITTTTTGRKPTLRERLRLTGSWLGAASESIGTWTLSCIFCVLLPCLPVGIEMLQAGHASDSGLLLTAAVLSVSYGVSAELNIYRAFYTATFLAALLLDAFGIAGQSGSPPPIPTSASILAHYSAPWLLLAVLVLHTSERVWWHLVWDRPFPDSLRGAT